MSKTLFAGLLAGALLVPQAAVGNEHNFQLPPIAYAETIPWLTGGAQKTMPAYLGLLLDPKPLTTSPTDFAVAPAPSRALLSTQLIGDAAASTR
jgi:hypothetical protein